MMCSEASPRVSFSHDSGQAEEGVLDMNSDFEFNIIRSSEQESCSADELFANGFILPVQFQNTSKQVQKCAAPPTVSLPPLPPPSHENSKKYLQIIEVNTCKKDLEERPSESKSFWGFKRSTSLNCDVKKSLIRSLLSRSNSTGTQQSPPPLKENKHHRAQKLQASSPPPPPSSSSSSSSSSNPYQSWQSKKNCHGNGVKVSPLLNLPPPYISKGTANLFGFGSLLRSNSSGGSKDKRHKK